MGKNGLHAGRIGQVISNFNWLDNPLINWDAKCDLSGSQPLKRVTPKKRKFLKTRNVKHECS